MVEFKLNVPERKTLVRRLEELTGIHPHYTRTPRCAYEIGAYAVERDGRLVAEEDAADVGLLKKLRREGIILDESGWLGEEEATEEEPVAEEPVAEEPMGDETVTEEPIEEEPTGEAAAEEAEEAAETETPPRGEDGGEVGAEVSTEVDTEVSAGAAEEAVEPETAEPDGLEISLPIGSHTGTSLRNLVNLLYSRGGLINKALGTHFSVNEELAEALKDDTCTYTVLNFCNALKDFSGQYGSGLSGLKITADRVTFTGFRLTDDADYTQACAQLCELMNRQALTQKRIQLRPVDDTNEKYAMRIWLVRIGMGGEEYKTSRRVLLGNLGGNGAFRTPEDAERAKDRLKAKKEREKAQGAAEVAENPAEAGTDAENAAVPAETEPDTAGRS